jgi:osmotically-inducible protein OsmY
MSKDSKLQKAVLAELAWDPQLAADHIGVSADEGVITLSGHVASFWERFAAEAAAKRVKGVKAVAETIEVKLAFDATRDDSEIAAAAVARLAWEATVPLDAITISVQKGWITLSGCVYGNHQKVAAETAVRTLRGVVGLTSQITIKAGSDAGAISDDIVHALHRSWFFDPKTIGVTEDRGVVRLTGSVSSPHDRQVAAETAWAAQGVVEVQNDIYVD